MMSFAKHVQQYNRLTVNFQKVIDTYYAYRGSLNFPKNGPFAVMDIGCASGRALTEVLHPFLPENYTELVGIDIDHSMIEYCRTLKVDPRISFEQMDIATEKLPEKFKNHFSLLFSSFCLMYVKDFRKALQNSHELLKMNGELLFSFLYKRNPVYEVYKELYRNDIWKPYTKEFKDFVPYYSSEDRETVLKNDFAEVCFELVRHEFHSDHHIRNSRRNLLDLFIAMNAISRSIPEEKKQHFLKDFESVLCDKGFLGPTNIEGIDGEVEINYPIVVIHAKKSEIV
ncbi:hypothetical protein HHI36_004566, partial [Cryptolaemus montrouzieri]